MKIAIVTDDNETISFRFGKAMKYADMTVDEEQIETGEIREKTGHLDYQSEGLVGQGGHQGDPREKGCGRHSGENHWRWLELILDCKIVLARGMDQRAYIGLRCMGIQPIITDIPDIRHAVRAVIDGNIQNHLDRLD